LDVSRNRLASLPVNLRSLRLLYANNNNITDLPDTLAPGLHVFEVRNNLLTHLPAALPPELRVFDLSYNQVQSVPEHITTALGQNCIVNLENNPLHRAERTRLRAAVNVVGYGGPQFRLSPAPISPVRTTPLSGPTARSRTGG
jgi:hypothetical protein